MPPRPKPPRVRAPILRNWRRDSGPGQGSGRLIRRVLRGAVVRVAPTLPLYPIGRRNTAVKLQPFSRRLRLGGGARTSLKRERRAALRSRFRLVPEFATSPAPTA